MYKSLYYVYACIGLMNSLVITKGASYDCECPKSNDTLIADCVQAPDQCQDDRDCSTLYKHKCCPKPCEGKKCLRCIPTRPIDPKPGK